MWERYRRCGKRRDLYTMNPQTRIAAVDVPNSTVPSGLHEFDNYADGCLRLHIFLVMIMLNTTPTNHTSTVSARVKELLLDKP